MSYLASSSGWRNRGADTSATGWVCQRIDEINSKLADIPVIDSKVDSLMLIKEKVDKIEESTQYLSKQYDELLWELKRRSTEIAVLKKKVEQVEGDNASQGIRKLRQQVNSLERYSRRQNLETHRLPQCDNDNLFYKMNDLAKQLQLAELTQDGLEGIHRLPPKPGTTPVVLICFMSRIKRDQWMAKLIT